MVCTYCACHYNSVLVAVTLAHMYSYLSLGNEVELLFDGRPHGRLHQLRVYLKREPHTTHNLARREVEERISPLTF